MISASLPGGKPASRGATIGPARHSLSWLKENRSALEPSRAVGDSIFVAWRVAVTASSDTLDDVLAASDQVYISASFRASLQLLHLPRRCCDVHSGDHE